MPPLSGSFRGGGAGELARQERMRGSELGPRIRGTAALPLLQTLIADLLHGYVVARFAARVLDAERRAVLAALLVLMIDGGGGRGDRRGAVAEIEDVFDDGVAELGIGRRGVGIEGARGVEVHVEVLPLADGRGGEDGHRRLIRTALR